MAGMDNLFPQYTADRLNKMSRKDRQDVSRYGVAYSDINPLLVKDPFDLSALEKKQVDEYYKRRPEAQSFSAENQARNQAALRGEANRFRQKVPGLIREETNQLKNESQGALDQGLKNTRLNFSRRGLLHSGAREGGEQTLRGRAANQMAKGIRDVNEYYAKTADAKDRAVAEAGLQNQQLALQRQSELDNLKMQNQVARTQALQQLGGGIGMGLGGYYGSKDKVDSLNLPEAGSSAQFSPSRSYLGGTDFISRLRGGY